MFKVALKDTENRKMFIHSAMNLSKVWEYLSKYRDTDLEEEFEANMKRIARIRGISRTSKQRILAILIWRYS